MDRIKHFFKHISVRITAYFLLSFVAALAIILVTMSFLYRDRLTEEINLVSTQKMSLTGTRLSYQLAEIRSLHFSLLRDALLLTRMRAQREQPGLASLSDTVAMKEEIARIIRRYASVRSIILIGGDGQILDPIYAAEPYASAILNDPEYKAFLSTGMTGRFSVPSGFPVLKDLAYETRNTITYYGRYYDTDTYEPLGTVAINVAKGSLTDELEQLFQTTFSAAWVLDENGSVIVRTGDGDKLNPKDVPAPGSVSLNGVPYVAYHLELTEYPNWTLVGLVSYEAINAPVRSLTLVLLAVSALLLVALVTIGGTISSRITKPLRELGADMAELGRGSWQPTGARSSALEIEDLLTGYNTMVDSLHTLTDEITREQIEKRKIKVSMLQSQLDLLQSQINPHFIHNTLNTMRYMAQKAGNQELNDLIVSFNSLLRASMSQVNMVNPLAVEIENLHHYLNIQLKRYDVELEFVVDAPEDTLSVEVPKLLLQPLVENALFHGILPIGKGKIKLVARLAEGRLWITLIDNGAGIAQDVLDKLLKGSPPNARGYNQIGMNNVNDRLKLFYGPSSHLVIESREMNGTAIGFSVPAGGPAPNANLPS
jgi:two-component system, sensor histidine kinase YesM